MMVAWRRKPVSSHLLLGGIYSSRCQTLGALVTLNHIALFTLLYLSHLTHFFETGVWK